MAVHTSLSQLSVSLLRAGTDFLLGFESNIVPGTESMQQNAF